MLGKHARARLPRPASRLADKFAASRPTGRVDLHFTANGLAAPPGRPRLPLDSVLVPPHRAASPMIRVKLSLLLLLTLIARAAEPPAKVEGVTFVKTVGIFLNTRWMPTGSRFCCCPNTRAPR